MACTRRSAGRPAFAYNSGSLSQLHHHGRYQAWARIHGGRTKSGRARGQNPRQSLDLCDVLLVCGDDVLIFSDKNIAWPKGDDFALSWSRWAPGSRGPHYGTRPNASGRSEYRRLFPGQTKRSVIGKGQLEMAQTITQGDPLNEIKLLFSDLAASRQEFDFLPPALVSHANQYATQPERLRKYARQVISARIMIFLVSSRINTQVRRRAGLYDVAFWETAVDARSKGLSRISPRS